MPLRPRNKPVRAPDHGYEPNRGLTVIPAKADGKMHLRVSSIQQNVAKLLKYSTFEAPTRFWLDTGHELLNAVLGSRTQGIPYGKLIEIFGEEHVGKTLLAQYLAGLAQKENAGCGRGDIEDSRDDAWDRKLGLNSEEVFTVAPKLLKVGKSGTLRLQSAEEIFEEIEAGFHEVAKQGFKKQFWYVDSIAMLNTSMVLEAGATGRNMRTQNDRAMFLSSELPKWAGLAANYNALIVLVNQLRNKPGFMFGDPTDSPGGRAMKHSVSIRAKVRRKGPPLRSKNTGRVIGLTSIIANVKNKAGGGCNHGAEAGFRIKWAGEMARVEFLERSELEASIRAGRLK